MSGLFYNSEGVYLLDMSVATANNKRELPIRDSGELTRFVASYLYALEMFDAAACTIDQLCAEGSVWFRDVRLAPSMSLLLIPKDYCNQIWISFGTLFPSRIFIENIQSVGHSPVGTTRQFSRVPLVVGSVSSQSQEETNTSRAHRWNIYVRFPLPDEITQQLIEKVVFELHETFTPPQREISSPGPFEISEIGWGEFVVGIDVFFTHGGVFKTSHQLQIFHRTSHGNDESPSQGNVDQSDDTNELVRNESFKTIEIPSELLTEGINHALHAFEEGFDRTFESQQNNRLADVCSRIQASIVHEKKVLFSLQQKQLFSHHDV